MNFGNRTKHSICLQSKTIHRGCVATALQRLHQKPPHDVNILSDYPISGQLYSEEHKTMNAQLWQADRRSFPRRDSGSEVALIKRSPEVMADEQQQQWDFFSTKIRGPLLDISMNGISFLVEEHIEVSETVYLRLSNPKFDTTLDVKAHVIRSAKVDGNRWKVVCQFYQNLAFEDITKFARNMTPSFLV